MGYKELCCEWVDNRKEETSDGQWYIVDWPEETRIEGPFATEEEIDTRLWNLLPCDIGY